jgi:diamine N-acetyltransferase
MIFYRAPQPEDASALAALARETFDQAFAHLYSAEDLAAFHAEWKTPEAFAAWIGDPRVRILVASDEEGMIGYAMIGFDIKLDYDPGDRSAVELKQLYLRARHHGKGVAQRLMDWVIEQAQSISADEIVLSVYSGNDRGMAFYHKYGFAKIADTIFIVGSQIDAEYLYAKRLTG